MDHALGRLPLPEIRKFRVYSPFRHNVQAIASRGNVEVGNFLMATEDEDHRDVSASEAAGLPELLDDPIRRRSWLLAKALQTHPLDQALDLHGSLKRLSPALQPRRQRQQLPLPTLANRPDPSRKQM